MKRGLLIIIFAISINQIFAQTFMYLYQCDGTVLQLPISCIDSIKYGSSSYPAGSIFCNGPTAVVDVINPITGKTWMDRNLGASRAATSSTDSLAYGDSYQWGRGNDGHQCRNSSVTTTLSSTDQPGNSNYIKSNALPYDWRNPQNDLLWQGVNGINNPCPIGYRIPTITELDAERSTWSQNNGLGAISSPLKLTIAGGRNATGILYLDYGDYWSSSIFSSESQLLDFDSSNYANITSFYRATGFSVRCIKN